MFLRLRSFAVMCAACAALSLRPVFADGEYEDALKKEFIDGFIGAYTEAGGVPPERQVAERTADCVVEYAMVSVNADERKRLDAWALGGPTPDSDLVKTTMQRMKEAALSGMCDQPAATQ